MAINIEQVKRRRKTAQPRRPNYHRLKRHHSNRSIGNGGDVCNYWLSPSI
ncbi:hypothetical protein [Leuconostoc suionicum]|nr:hypothetical protein [Leuconostoc suionicum]